MYKYGIVSVASIAKRFMEGVRLAGDEVVCVASRDINKAEKFAKDNSIEKYYGNYEEVYKDKDVDIVYIPVINNLHYECCKQALLHNKHVVLEKPFVGKPFQAQELYALARSKNRLLFEGVKNLFVPSTKFVMDNLDKLGKVTNVVSLQGTRNPFPEGHWMYDIKQGGGAYAGSAAYVYHYLRYIFKSEVSNLDGTYVPSSGSDLTCNFTFNLGDIKVDSTIDLKMDLDNTCIIYGEKGKMTIDEYWRSHHVLIETNDGNKYEFSDEGSEFVYEAKHIQECLDKDLIESPIVKEEDSISEVRNIEYLYKKWGLIIDKDDKITKLTKAIEYLQTNPKIEFNPYPQYDSKIRDVLDILGSDTEYLTKYEQIKDKQIETMNLDELKVMFTFVARGERFAEGFIASAIEDKTLLRLATRTLQLLK